jgi:hypothetical protein
VLAARALHRATFRLDRFTNVDLEIVEFTASRSRLVHCIRDIGTSIHSIDRDLRAVDSGVDFRKGAGVAFGRRA